MSKFSSVMKAHENLLGEIEKHFKLYVVDYKEMATIPKEKLKIVFIATGGCERLFTQHFESLPYPAVLLTDGLQNSLAAALEISTWLRYKGMKSKVVHGENSAVLDQLSVMARNFYASASLQAKRVGVIGPASPWLIASDVDYLLAKRRWGLEFTDIRLEEVYELFDKISPETVAGAAAAFAGKASDLCEAAPDDVVKAMRLYEAIRLIGKKENLSAVTLSCFTLLEQLHTTGCLALSLLNDDGILAGCEGDLQAIFTMMTVKSVTGMNGFMANPSVVDVNSNEVLLAHCTVPTSLTDQYIVRNHFESNSGVSIQGILPTGEVTIAKCGGECLDEFFVSSGMLIENTNNPNSCRTQVRVRLNNPVSYFLRNSLGNHHILIPGNHASELEDFFVSNHCRKMV